MNRKPTRSSSINTCFLAFWGALILALFFLPLSARAGGLTEQQILKGADSRIEQYRKGDLTLRLVGADGLPIGKGSLVEIEQVRHQFLFGANLSRFKKSKTAAANAAYEQHFAELFNYATLFFFWKFCEPRPGKLTYKTLNGMVAWCRVHGIKATGHPLCWNTYEPKWLPKDPLKTHRLLMERIAREIKRFKNDIAIWYVVNEMTNYDEASRLKFGRQSTRAIQAVGAEQHTRQAFEIARATDPRATLIINDYNLTEAYADKVLAKLVDKQGKPLYDAIGIQAHQHAQVWTPKETWDNCERFARFGKPLHISEVTITSGKLGWNLTAQDPNFKWESTPEGEKRQAEQVARFYTILFSHPAVEAISWWDFTDENAWTHAPAGLLRADMTPKPAYTELMKLIKGKWWTRCQQAAQKDGIVQFRGFFGDYRITIKGADGRVQKGTFTAGRDARGVIEVRLQ